MALLIITYSLRFIGWIGCYKIFSIAHNIPILTEHVSFIAQGYA